MQKECSGWLDELSQATPSIVVRVSGKDGCDAEKASVIVDGVPSSANGAPIELDPGTHQVRVEVDGAPASEQRIVLAESERHRLIAVTFAAPGATCHGPPSPSQSVARRGERDETRPVPPLVIGVAALGAVVLGVGAILEVSSLLQRADFERCMPGCSSDRVGAWETKWRIADVATSVGVLTLAVAGYFYFTRPAVRTSAFSPGLRF